jgi:spore maturation protein CgeB
LGARQCVPIYNALDPATHYPRPADPRLAADLLFIGHRLPDRRERISEFFLKVAAALPDRRFLLGGNGWEKEALPANVEPLGHVFTYQHNLLNCSARAVLNVNRSSMATFGYSPPTRFFEAAGAGACLITDAWDGIDAFLVPDEEVLVAATGREVAEIVTGLTEERARTIGAAARRKVISQHTYEHRAALVEDALACVSAERVA